MTSNTIWGTAGIDAEPILGGRRRPGGRKGYGGARCIIAHKLPICETTGLPRYRDRHQARHAALAGTSAGWDGRWATFACQDCRGFHLEKLTRPLTATRTGLRKVSGTAPSEAGPGKQRQMITALEPKVRRYVLVDIENLTAGCATYDHLARTWTVLKEAGLVVDSDQIVVGAGRLVAHRFSTAIADPNVRWVVGAAGPDGADRALLAAINVHDLAKRYDELVIMSGDHAFTALAESARRRGVKVVVVTAVRDRRGNQPLARCLAAAADQTVTVPLAETGLPAPGAAA